MASPNIMVVAHSLEVQQALTSYLGRRGLATVVASTAREAETVLTRHCIQLVFCSDELPGGGIEGLIRNASQPPAKMQVVVVSRLDDWQRYLSFLRAGAFDYVLYPPNGDEIERVMRTVLNSGSFGSVEQVTAAG
jgi:DNA-binding NtrC family response regulator